VEVAPTFSSSLANVNNHDLVHHNYGQINENSESMYLDEEIRKEDLPEEMHQELDQILAQCDFLYQVAISKNNKNNSDLSNSSVIMATKPNSVHSESVTTKESSLAVEEHINQKETAMLDFSEAGVVVHLLVIIMPLSDKFRLTKVQNIKLLRTKTKEARRDYWHVDTR
jgi:hypothetical protein